MTIVRTIPGMEPKALCAAPVHLQITLGHIYNAYADHVQIFTDGLTADGSSASDFVAQHLTHQKSSSDADLQGLLSAISHATTQEMLQLWVILTDIPSYHYSHIFTIDRNLRQRLSSDVPRKLETIIHHLCLNAAYTSSYKFMLGHIDSPDCLGCGCVQAIEPTFCSCAVSYEHQKLLEEHLHLLDKRPYNLTKILGPWRTPGHQ